MEAVAYLSIEHEAMPTFMLPALAKVFAAQATVPVEYCDDRLIECA
jgi:hypothetical protein